MVPLRQVLRVASYIMEMNFRGVERYPLVLMLEPLFQCNLACVGCGKIQHPKSILERRMPPEKALQAARECGAPVVSIAGGEPLIHPEMPAIIQGLIAQKRYTYLCTNTLLLPRFIDRYSPSPYFTWSIHLDGLQDEHDHAVDRDGVFEVALNAIKTVRSRGFRVTTNTTLFNNADPARVRAFFDTMSELGVEGMTISPGYAYESAPLNDIFLPREQTRQLFREILRNPSPRWRFNHSPNYLAFLRGEVDYACTPWGNPTYNLFGWQRPCYLLNDGHVPTFRELMENTPWENYGHQGPDPRCHHCMAHCGYEPTAVQDTFGSLAGLARTLHNYLKH